jgi:hypothetical protein
MALRCTEWNRALWRRVWKAEQYISDPWAEQRALIEFYKAEPEVRTRHTRHTQRHVVCNLGLGGGSCERGWARCRPSICSTC